MESPASHPVSRPARATARATASDRAGVLLLVALVLLSPLLYEAFGWLGG
jgi:hypothetical protein